MTEERRVEGMVKWWVGFRRDRTVEIDVGYDDQTWQTFTFPATEEGWDEARQFEYDLTDEMYRQQKRDALRRGRPLSGTFR